jgi:hypothetical protein
MSNDEFPMAEFFAFLLWFLKEDYLTANECTALVYLGCLADRDGCGHVQFERMSRRFGRVPNCCRRYLHRAKRHGVIERWKPDGEGGAAFRLFVPPADTGEVAKE